MARPEAPFYVGTTRPGTVGWTRITVTVVAGVVLMVVLTLRDQPTGLFAVIAIGVLFTLLALWTWMGQWTRFIVDEHGVTVSLGGFWPRQPWPVEDFRTVQLREISQSTVGVTVGGYGWRRGRVISAAPSELRPVGRRKIFTTDVAQQKYRLLVTRPGTMVEIIGRGETCYLLTPEDPQATAEAVDQAIRSRR